MFSSADFASVELHLILLALASATAAECLVALWAAWSSRHWFWRAFAVWAAVTAFLPIRAYGPALVFAVSSLLTIAAIRSAQLATRLWPFQPAKLASYVRFSSRFHLSTLLLVILLLGLSLSSLLYVHKQMEPVPWIHVLLPAVVIASHTCLVYLLVRGPARILAAILLLAAVPLFAWVLWPEVAWLYQWGELELGLYRALGELAETYYHGLAATILGQFELIALLFVALLCASSSLVATRWARISISFARSALAIAAAALLVLYVCLISFSPLPPPPAASTNHEGEIVQIAARVKSLNPQPQALADLAAADPQGVAAPELRELYQKLETLLEADNAIIIREPDCTNAYFDSASMDRIQTCRHLGRALQAEIKSLAAASNYQRAAQRARANLRLGLMFGRGGLYLDMLVGQSIISTHTLADVAHFRDRLDAPSARALIADLQRCEQEFEPFDTITNRDVAFCQRAVGWTTHLEQIIGLIVHGTALDAPNAQSTLKSRLHLLAVIHLVQADLALRLYRADRGDWPAELADLVPAYLPGVPVDTLVGRPLIYRRTGGEFLLYSVGNDGLDQGGKFTNRATYFPQDGFDFDLDTFTRP